MNEDSFIKSERFLTLIESMFTQNFNASKHSEREFENYIHMNKGIYFCRGKK